jgi:hypothetical protein
MTGGFSLVNMGLNDKVLVLVISIGLKSIDDRSSRYEGDRFFLFLL